MAKNSTTSENKEFELVSPVKILVKPGFSGGKQTASSLRRRSAAVIEIFSPKSARPSEGGGETENIFVVSNQVIGPEEGRKLKKDATISIQNGVVRENKNVAYYLQHYFRLMYLTGMSTYDPENKKDGGGQTWKDSIVSNLQKIAFWAVASTSLLFSLLLLKTFWVLFLSDRGVLIFVYVGNWLFTIVSEVYFIYLLVFCHQRIKDKMIALKNIGTYTIDEIGTKKIKCNNPHKLITTIFLVSIFACLMDPMGGSGIQGWSPKELILDSSTTLSIQLFIWHPDDLAENSTKLESISRDYGTELTSVTLIMGFTEIGMRFWSNLKMDTVQNLGVVVAVLTWLRNRYFGRKVKNIDIESYTNGYDTDVLDSPTGLFAEFQHVVRKENRLMNGLVGGLLKIIHAYNIMECATFLMRCLDNRATLTEFAFLLYGLMKVAIIYYFGKKAEAENEVYEQWIRNWAMNSRDPIFLGRVPAILDEMTKNPLGVGRGNFLVGHGFIFRFIGFVGSIFMLEVDDDDDE